MGTTVAIEVNTGSSLHVMLSSQDILTGRRAIEGDDFGGATAGGISSGSADDTAGQDVVGLSLVATLMEGIVTMAAHMSNIGHGRAHEGGRGGQNRTPHDDDS